MIEDEDWFREALKKEDLFREAAKKANAATEDRACKHPNLERGCDELYGFNLGYCRGYYDAASALYARINELEKRVAELESMAPRWVFRYSEEQEKLDNDGWYECDNTVINGVEYVFMVRDFPVPKEMLIEVKTDEIK